MTDMGELKCYVGINVVQGKQNNRIWLHQIQYIEKVIEKYR